MALPNPAWSNCALLRAWTAIEAHVGPKMMPRVTKHTYKKLIAIEYGHGVYGVVMPTSTKGVVVKVTTDPGEAHLISVLTHLRARPDGIVRYHGIYQLSGQHDGRPIFVLWREEAYGVGKVLESRADEEAANLLDTYFSETQKLARYSQNNLIDPRSVKQYAAEYWGETGYEHDGRGPNLLRRGRVLVRGVNAQAGFAAAAAVTLALELSHIPKTRAIGKSLVQLANREIIVTDLHHGNLGYVKRGGQKLAVITDPGHVVFLTTKYDRDEPRPATSGLSKRAKKKIASEPQAKCAT